MADHTQAENTEPAHDILAAEEFGMPAADPDLHSGPLVIPADPLQPAGEPPHDVLAAEEFAMPAVHRPHPLDKAEGAGASVLGTAVRAAAVLAAVLLLARLLRRR